MSENTQKARMSTGELYEPTDPEAARLQAQCLLLQNEYNVTSPLDTEKRQELLTKMFKKIGKGIAGGLAAIGKGFADIGSTFAKGDGITKGSFLVMGLGNMARGQILRGLLFCNLCCKICSHSFGLILATFGSRHRTQTSFLL